MSEIGQQLALQEQASEAQEALARARRREATREATRRPIDYERMQRTLPGQKARLTRALKPRDREQVVNACVEAVGVWDEIGAWPDEWSRWQRALDDVFPVFDAPLLEDLR